MLRSLLLIIALLTLLSDSSIAHAQNSGRPTVIRLKPQITCGESQVKLGDIAEITDSNASRHRALSELDLAAFDQENDLTIERSFVAIRIQLAGFDPETIRIQGPEQILIAAPRPESLTDLGVEQIVYETLCRQFSVPADELRVKLVTPFVGPWLKGMGELKHPHLDLMPTPQLPLGRTQMTVRILDGSRVAGAKAVTFEVSRRQQVVVANSSLNRMHVVAAEHIREETRFVDTPIDRLTAEQVVGRKVLMAFQPGEIVTLRHVGEQAVEEAPVLIQARDAVRLVARKHGLTVTVPVAEALQSGRQGQLIRVRNTQSNQIVTGVVVARGQVEIRLP